MAVRIQVRNGTASEWTSANPVLMQGEIGLELDTNKWKIGNGSSAWNSLAYVTQGIQGEQGDPLLWEDLTAEQKESLRGERGPAGSIDNMNGLIHFYSENLEDTSGVINLILANVFQITISDDTVFTILNAEENAHSFTLIINMGATVRTLTFPSSVKWQGGEIPDLSTANKTYILTFMTVDGGTNWLGIFGGEF